MSSVNVSKLCDDILKEIDEDVRCVIEGRDIDFLAKFRTDPTRRDPNWKWFYRDGDWVIIHGEPDEYYLDVFDVNTPYEASLQLWELKARPWFTRSDAKKYLEFVNKLNGWNYDFNALMKIAHPLIDFSLYEETGK